MLIFTPSWFDEVTFCFSFYFTLLKCPEPGCAVYSVIYDLPSKQVAEIQYDV